MLVRAVEKRAETFNPVHPRDPGLVNLFGGGSTHAGVTVTEEVALAYSVVFACVKILTETIGSTPFVTYRRNGEARERDTKHPLYKVLHTKSNPEMTSMSWREAMQVQLGLRGNGISEIVRTNAGEVSELWPLRADRTVASRKNGKLWYHTRLPNGQTRTLRRDQVLHIRGMGSSGHWGYSPLDQMREAVALGVATEQYGARFFSNDATPGLTLHHATNLSKPAQERLKASIEASHQGMENKHRVMVLEEGMTVEKVGISPENAQFLETRTYQIRDIARFFRMPLHMIQDLERATFSNIAEQSLEFVKYTMVPWFVRWEQQIQCDLIGEGEPNTFAEFVAEGLLRGDPKTRAEFYRQMWGIGAINQDEIRQRENMNPIADGAGQAYYVPLNFIEAGTDVARPAPMPDDDDSRDASATESRAVERRQRSAETRRRLAVRFEKPFADAARRVLVRERSKVMAEANKQLRSRDIPMFDEFLETFYREHDEFVRQQYGPVIETYAEFVADDARSIVDAEPNAEALAEFTAGLLAYVAQRHTASSKNQLRALLEQNIDDPIAAISERMDGWVESRPEQIAKRETVETSGAITKHVWIGAGVARMIWTAFGDNCPFCTGLNGKVVGITSSFASKGDTFEAEGREPLRLRTDITHPPIHRGCDCQISPG